MAPCCYAQDRGLPFHGMDCEDAEFCYSAKDVDGEWMATCMLPPKHEGDHVFTPNEEIK